MSAAVGSLEGTWPGQIRALPARITDRLGRFRRARARLTHIGMPGHLYLCRPWPRRPRRSGLDLRAPMVAPCLLGYLGSRRQSMLNCIRCAYDTVRARLQTEVLSHR